MENQSTEETPKILLIDDSQAFLNGLDAVLADKNMEVICHTSGQAALNSIKDTLPDAIVCDLEMPEMSGIDFIKHVRQEPGLLTVPILVLTGATDTEAMSRSIEAGADAFCSKDNIRFTIYPQLQSLLRLRGTYERALRGRQLEAVQALIGTFKHEFGNSIAILEGMLRKLTKNHPGTLTDPAMPAILSSIERIQETMEKMNKLRKYEEEQYYLYSKILKIG